MMSLHNNIINVKSHQNGVKFLNNDVKSMSKGKFEVNIVSNILKRVKIKHLIISDIQVIVKTILTVFFELINGGFSLLCFNSLLSFIDDFERIGLHHKIDLQGFLDFFENFEALAVGGLAHLAFAGKGGKGSWKV